VEARLAKIEGSLERWDVAARIKFQVSLLKAERAALLVRLTPDHPDAKVMDAKIVELERELQKYK